MNAPVNPVSVAETPTEQRSNRFIRAMDRAEQIAATVRGLRQTNAMLAIAGVSLGALGMLSTVGVTLYFLTREPDPPMLRIDQFGAVSRVARASEMKATFNEVTARQHLRAYMDNCLRYNYSTFAETSRRCQLFLTPAQQQKWAEKQDGFNPKSPRAVLGREGVIALADGVTMREVQRGKEGTLVWQLSYTEITAAKGAVACQPKLDMVTFRWRPELKMTDDDRDINAAGMQISDIASGIDNTRPARCS